MAFRWGLPLLILLGAFIVIASHVPFSATVENRENRSPIAVKKLSPSIPATQSTTLLTTDTETSYKSVELPEAENFPVGSIEHRPPESLLRAAEPLGKLSKGLKIGTVSLGEALNYYDSCAKSKKLLTAVRAVCLKNLIDKSKSVDVTIFEDSYDKEIVDLAKQLPLTP
jgi:hypothetical protein